MKKSFLLIILAGLMWGTSGIFVRLLTPYGLSSLQMVAVRGTVGAIAMIVYTLFTDRAAFRVPASRLLIYLGIGLSQFLMAYLYYASIRITSISTAAILLYTAPIFVTAYSVAFLGERMTRLKLISIGAMLAGCALVSGITEGFSVDPVGALLAIGSGICYAAYNIISKVGIEHGASPRSASLYAFITMSVIALPMSNPVDIVRKAIDPVAWVLFILLGVVTFFAPFFLYTLSLKRLPAGTASSLAIVEPMSATVYAMIFFGELPGAFGAVGIALILTAVYMLGRAEGGEKTDRKSEAETSEPSECTACINAEKELPESSEQG